jgi:predicted phage replisome organizer
MVGYVLQGRKSLSEDKKYYWLKMEGNFFNQKEIRKLRRIAGGDTYVIIYLKMSLLSLKDDGKLYYEGVEDSFAEELAYELQESIENVEMTISYLQTHKMLETHNTDELYMNRIPEMTGKETDSARRKRQQRLRDNNKPLQLESDIVPLDCDIVQKSHTEKEIETKQEVEIDLDKDLELIYKHYPKAKDRKDCYELIKKLLKKYSKEDLLLFIDRYKNETDLERKSFPDLKYKNSKTFFNKAILNYTNEYWEEPQQEAVNKLDRANCKTQEEWRYYNYMDIAKDDLENPDNVKRISELKREMEESFK